MTSAELRFVESVDRLLTPYSPARDRAHRPLLVRTACHRTTGPPAASAATAAASLRWRAVCSPAAGRAATLAAAARSAGAPPPRRAAATVQAEVRLRHEWSEDLGTVNAPGRCRRRPAGLHPVPGRRPAYGRPGCSPGRPRRADVRDGRPPRPGRRRTGYRRTGGAGAASAGRPPGWACGPAWASAA